MITLSARRGALLATGLAALTASCGSEPDPIRPSSPVTVEAMLPADWLRRIAEPSADSATVFAAMEMELWRLALIETLTEIPGVSVEMMSQRSTVDRGFFTPDVGGVLGGGMVTRAAVPEGGKEPDAVDVWVRGTPIIAASAASLRVRVMTRHGVADDVLIPFLGEGSAEARSIALDRVAGAVAGLLGADPLIVSEPALMRRLSTGMQVENLDVLRLVVTPAFFSQGAGWYRRLATRPENRDSGLARDFRTAILAAVYWQTSVRSWFGTGSWEAAYMESDSVDLPLGEDSLGVLFLALLDSVGGRGATPEAHRLIGLGRLAHMWVMRDWRGLLEENLNGRSFNGDIFAGSDALWLLESLECWEAGRVLMADYRDRLGRPPTPSWISRREAPPDTVVRLVPLRFMDRLPEPLRAGAPEWLDRRLDWRLEPRETQPMEDVLQDLGTEVPTAREIREAYTDAGMRLDGSLRAQIEDRLDAIESLQGVFLTRDFEIAALEAMLGRPRAIERLVELSRARSLKLVDLEYDPALESVRNHRTVQGLIDAHYQRIAREEAYYARYAGSPLTDDIRAEGVDICLAR